MTWDSLIKANQGGIAIFGGTIAGLYGYRGCFVVTLMILIFRWCIWTGYLASRGFRKAEKKATDGRSTGTSTLSSQGSWASDTENEASKTFDTEDREDLDPN